MDNIIKLDAYRKGVKYPNNLPPFFSECLELFEDHGYNIQILYGANDNGGLSEA